jgi:hypothetical protein
MIQDELFWVVMPCSVVVGYQRFGGPCCFHLQGEVAGMGENDIDIVPDWRKAAGAMEGMIRQPVYCWFTFSKKVS